jgi:uncharacterized FAD-dependent dehydrogenase
MQASSEEFYRPEIARSLGTREQDITHVRILRKSIDARNKNIKINITFQVYAGEKPASLLENTFNYHHVSQKPEVIITGAGPAGLFAALRLIELGFKPVLLERGNSVETRKYDIDMLESNHLLNKDSNYCFGEGGAGAFSDGKLYTRSKKRGDITRILEILYLHGAQEEILYESHPHIGSDKLPPVVAAIRKTILNAGGIIRFGAKLTDMNQVGGMVRSITLASGEVIKGEAFILATGHSARDIYYLLQAKGFALESKAFAMGVRVEHPQELIDHIQYHGRRDKYLPAATYSLAEQVNGRGVYSFCMCPGGRIVPSATSDYEIVVNGMSLSDRGSLFANAGIVVQVTPADFRSYQNKEGLAGIRLQELYEQKAYRQVHNGQKAPAQRLTDFLINRNSQDLPVSSYLPGLVPSPMHEWMPEFIRKNIQEAFHKFNARMKGFLTREAIIVGVESRTY